MSNHKEVRDGGQNARPLNDTIAGTAHGIADDAAIPGQDAPEAPSDEEVLAIARKLHAPIPGVEDSGSG